MTEFSSDSESVFQQRDGSYSREKGLIAEYVADVLERLHCTSFAIDGGSTNAKIFKVYCLRCGGPRTVTTNNLAIVQHCVDQAPPGGGLTVFCPGGEVRPSRETLIGEEAARNVRARHFPVCVVGAAGFDPPRLFTQTGQEHGVKLAMLAGAQTVICPLVSPKWGHVAGKELISVTDLVAAGKRVILTTTLPLQDTANQRDPEDELKFFERTDRFVEHLAKLNLTWKGSLDARVYSLVHPTGYRRAPVFRRGVVPDLGAYLLDFRKNITDRAPQGFQEEGFILSLELALGGAGPWG